MNTQTEHTLRMVGDNVTLITSAWLALLDELRPDSTLAARIRTMLANANCLPICSAPDLVVGQRVQAAPHTDIWMQGDRYGVVTYDGRTHYNVKMNRSGRTLRFAARGELLPI